MKPQAPKPQPRRILGYQIISAVDQIAFLADVNKAIIDGWQPHGGPFLHGHALCQAIVKFE